MMIKKIGILALLVTLVASTTVASVMACTWTPGYWKNHPDAWPTSATPMTIGGNQYSKNDLLVFLRTPVRGDAWMNLMQKYIAMQLSKATVYGTDADYLLEAAEEWFDDNPTGPIRANTPAGQAGLAIAGELDYLLNLWHED